MKDSLRWIAGGLVGIVLALAGVVGVGYAAGVQLGHAPPAAQVEPQADPAPLPHVVQPEVSLTRTLAPAPIVEPVHAAPTESSAPLRVRRLVVASGIEGHEPTGVAESFPTGTRVYAFVEAVNETGAPEHLQVTFVPEHGERTGFVSLDVPSAHRWRTWAYTRNIGSAGNWEAIVRGPDGTVLARQSFEVR